MDASVGRTSESKLRVQRAIVAFVRSAVFVRSFTHPRIGQRVGRLWRLCDAERKTGHYRNEEWVAYRVTAAEVDRTARRTSRGRYAVSALVEAGEDDAEVRKEFKALNYRLRTTEAMMAHSLESIPEASCSAKIQRVTTPELADRLAQAARTRQILPDDLHSDRRMRQYVAILNGNLVGWVLSLVAGNDVTACSSMFVEPKFRRQGIARAMLCRMLRDDRAKGATMAMLLASHTGAKLYSRVGYEQIGNLLVFMPRR
jgi:GNAT superfamily N-acetyltransferase